MLLKIEEEAKARGFDNRKVTKKNELGKKMCFQNMKTH